MPRLVIEKGPEKGKILPLPGRGTALFGRDSSASYQLKDGMTSRLHFKIDKKDDGYWLYDLESMNGTLLNGAKVQEARLAAGDLIRIGETLFTFHLDDTAVDGEAPMGQRMGGYRILERVGRGGMGTVYKAEQIDLQRIVALKVISEEHIKDKDYIELFIHEARAAAKLNHPNIVQVYDVKRTNNVYYFSMEFVEGGSVQDILTRQRKIPVDDAVRMILDAARGLDYAHKRGIIHRDVKPDNFMLSETGMVKIGDMGLARGLEEQVGPQEETSVIGTPHYIAPEQVLGKPADFRSDIYSLGGTMYRMLAGVTSHQAPSVRDLVNKKVREDAPPIHDFNEDVPKRLSEICARMMARDPDKRYQSMGDVVAALEGFQRERAGLPVEGKREASGPIETLVGNRKLLVSAIILLAVVVVGGVMGALFLSKEASVEPKESSAGRDEERAGQLLWVAERFRFNEMKKGDAKSLQRAIGLFDEIVQKHGRTESARKAGASKTELEKELRGLVAERKLEDLDKADVEAYGRMLQSFQAERLDLGPVESTIAAYRDLGQGEDGKETSAGGKALARAQHIGRWKEALLAHRREFEAIVADAQQKSAQRLYKKAWDALRDFQVKVGNAELACDFARDRYKALLYDQSASSEQKKIVQAAEKNWAEVQQEADRLAKRKEYEAAIALVQPAAAESLEAISKAAQRLAADLALEHRDHLASLKKAEAEAKAEVLRAALVAFERESLAAHAHVQRYEFAQAAATVKRLKDPNVPGEIGSRIERRLLSLEWADRFMNDLITAMNGAVSRFKKDYVSPAGLSGTVEAASDRGFRLVLKQSGTVDRAWADFRPQEFHQFVRSQWKPVTAKPDPDDAAAHRCGFAAVCLEFGLYEEALEQIEIAIKDDEYQGNPDVKLLCDTFKTMLEKGEWAECDEVEARKRLARLETFVKSQNFNAARAEVDVLRTRLSKTKAVGESAEKIDKHLERINKEGGEQLNKSLKEDAFKKFDARVKEEQAAAKKSHAEVVARLNRLEDGFEKYVHLGAAYASVGELTRSTEKYLAARRAGDAMVEKGSSGPETVRALGLVYEALQQNHLMAKDRRSAEAVRNDGSKLFVSPIDKQPEPWWKASVEWVIHWGDNIHLNPLFEKELEKRKAEVRAAPEDPHKIWMLARSYSEGLLSPIDARGYYMILRESHPDFAEVRNGNCLQELAEAFFAAREVREAAKLYRELERSHPEHEKVKGAGRIDSVKNRLDACAKLIAKLGLKDEAPGK